MNPLSMNNKLSIRLLERIQWKKKRLHISSCDLLSEDACQVMAAPKKTDIIKFKMPKQSAKRKSFTCCYIRKHYKD